MPVGLSLDTNRRVVSRDPLWRFYPEEDLGPVSTRIMRRSSSCRKRFGNGSRLSVGRMSAAAVTVLSVYLYHRRSLDIVLTSDRADMQIRISIIAGIGL